MSVLACDRQGCENIMCELCSDEHGYICYDCRDELISLGETSIYAFMQTPKDESKPSQNWETYVHIEFKEFRE